MDKGTLASIVVGVTLGWFAEPLVDGAAKRSPFLKWFLLFTCYAAGLLVAWMAQ